jgi:hypothetical protein
MAKIISKDIQIAQNKLKGSLDIRQTKCGDIVARAKWPKNNKKKKIKIMIKAMFKDKNY